MMKKFPLFLSLVLLSAVILSGCEGGWTRGRFFATNPPGPQDPDGDIGDNGETGDDGGSSGDEGSGGSNEDGNDDDSGDVGNDDEGDNEDGGSGGSGNGGNGDVNNNPAPQALTRQQLFFLAMLNEADRHFRTHNFDLRVLQFGNGPVEIRIEPFPPGQRLLSISGNEVTFHKNRRFKPHGTSASVPISGPIVVNGVLFNPVVGVDGNGNPFFTITLKVAQPSGFASGTIPGSGRVVNDNFRPIRDRRLRLEFITLQQQGNEVIGEIISGNKTYGTFEIDFITQLDPNAASVELTIFNPPVLR